MAPALSRSHCSWKTGSGVKGKPTHCFSRHLYNYVKLFSPNLILLYQKQDMKTIHK